MGELQRWVRVGMVAVFVLLFFPLSTQATLPLSHRPGELLVTFRDVPTPVRMHFASEQDAATAARTFQKNDTVENVAKNSLVHLAAVNTAEMVNATDPFVDQQWYLSQMGVPSAWSRGQGSKSVVVAVLDTGVDIHHPDLQNNIWVNPREQVDGLDNDQNGYADDIYGWDFVDHVGVGTPKFDVGWNQTALDHGTVVSGIIGAVGNNGIGIAGLAWNVRIMPVRVLDSSGSGDVDTVAQAIDYAVRAGATVLNLSFVGDEQNSVLDSAIRRAHDAGVVVVAAAGNDAHSTGGVNLDATPQYPACSDGGSGQNNVIGVAATTQDDHKAGFSDFGSHCVDLTAPGVRIYSTRFLSTEQPGFTEPYGGYWQGTSFATPMVTGAVALMRSINPSLTPDDVVRILRASATPIDALNPSYGGKLGAGRLNVASAVDMAARDVPQGAPVKHVLGVGAPLGAVPEVRLFNQDGAFLRSFLAYDKKMKGGVMVAAGDVDGDGHDEIITVPASSAAAQVKIFHGNGTLMKSFSAFDAKNTSGFSLGVGDVNGDGRADIVIAALRGAPEVRVFDGHGNREVSFLAYQPSFRGGVWVSVGDVQGDGVADIVTGPGAGGGPHVRIFDGSGQAIGGFFAGEEKNRAGIRLAVGDVQAEGAGLIGVMSATGNTKDLSVYNSFGTLIGVVSITTKTSRFPFAFAQLSSTGRASLLVVTPNVEGMALTMYDIDGTKRGYVATYPPGTKNFPTPFVVKRP